MYNAESKAQINPENTCNSKTETEGLQVSIGGEISTDCKVPCISTHRHLLSYLCKISSHPDSNQNMKCFGEKKTKTKKIHGKVSVQHDDV